MTWNFSVMGGKVRRKEVQARHRTALRLGRLGMPNPNDITGDELSTLLPAILGKAFKGEP